MKEDNYHIPIVSTIKRRYAYEHAPFISSSDDLISYCYRHFHIKDKPLVGVIYVDVKGRVVEINAISSESLKTSLKDFFVTGLMASPAKCFIYSNDLKEYKNIINLNTAFKTFGIEVLDMVYEKEGKLKGISDVNSVYETQAEEEIKRSMKSSGILTGSEYAEALKAFNYGGFNFQYNKDKYIIGLRKERELISKTGDLKDTEVALIDELRLRSKEHFCIMSLDEKDKPIAVDISSIGDKNSSIVSPYEVTASGILLNAKKVICYHNHPSGDVKKSRQDVSMTERLEKAFSLIGIKLLDHVIVGREIYSFNGRDMTGFDLQETEEAYIKELYNPYESKANTQKLNNEKIKNTVKEKEINKMRTVISGKVSLVKDKVITTKEHGEMNKKTIWLNVMNGRGNPATGFKLVAYSDMAKELENIEKDDTLTVIGRLNEVKFDNGDRDTSWVIEKVDPTNMLHKQQNFLLNSYVHGEIDELCKVNYDMLDEKKEREVEANTEADKIEHEEAVEQDKKAEDKEHEKIPEEKAEYKNEEAEYNIKDYWVIEYNETSSQVDKDYSGEIVTKGLIDELRKLDEHIKTYNDIAGHDEFGHTTDDFVGYHKFYFNHIVNGERQEKESGVRIDIGDGEKVNRREWDMLFDAINKTKEYMSDEKEHVAEEEMTM